MKQKTQAQNKQAIISFLHTANWLQGKIADLLAPYKLSLQQLKILAIVYDQPSHTATVNTIRERMLDPMSNVSRLLNKLMEKQYIEKVRSSEDQRVVHIHILPAGIEIMAQGRKSMDEGLNVLCHLDADELAQLEHLMEKIRK